MLQLPEAFKQKYQQLLGDDKAQNLFASLQKKPKKAFRINSLKKNKTVSYATDKPVPVVPNAYYGSVKGEDPEWVSGTVYSQDPAAMFPAYLAQVKPGQTVLDLCAAPGGKTTALGEALQNHGLLIANEISAARAKALRENLERWGISNALITNDDSFALAKKFPAFFDLILVDAPCSGEGMFRKNPNAISYWSPDYVQTCQERQKEILQETVKMLKPGGKLVYSTCTFSPEEDEEIVAWLLDTYNMQLQDSVIDHEKISHGRPDFVHPEKPALRKCLRFWPQDNLGEGQFAAILTLPKAEEFSAVGRKKTKKHQKRNKLGLTKNEKELVAQVLARFNLPIFLQNWQEKVLVRKDHVFLPAYTGNLAGLKIMNNGIELGLLKKKRFEPGHQLAEILGQVQQQTVYDIETESAYKKYLHGETLRVKTDLRGFVLISYHNLIFSFGKITGNGVLKNFYPKGLRALKGD